MTALNEYLSAYLDGELSPSDMQEVEAALAADPALQAELEALMAADSLAQEAFDAALAEPVPVALAAAIRDYEPTPVANAPAPPRALRGLAAMVALVALLVGATGGYFAGTANAPAPVVARGWLQDIADYHRVYAAQKRHLVEVGADEADHIETWLSKTVGTDVRIPDLTAQGLTFQGGRLLVAVGKPVAQLLYTDAGGAVVALCLIQTNSPQAGVQQRTLGDFDMVTWGAGTANYVIVGDKDRPDLDTIAAAAARDV